jgi:hypothetical protein
MNKAPWRDFAGNELYEGDVISHPSGERGKIVFLPQMTDPHARWRVDYGDGTVSSNLGLQIGDKGRAVKVTDPTPEKP